MISMYLEHFRLNKAPFGAVPDPEFIWLGPQQARVLETLSSGVFDGEGCLVLTGDIGTGKTILAKRMVAQEGVASVYVTLSGPGLTGLDVYRLLAEEYGINRAFNSRAEFIAGFGPALLQAFDAAKKVIVVVDEAQRLTPDALKDLAALSDLRSNGKKLLKIVLVGPLDFKAEAIVSVKDGLGRAPAASCRLEPLSEEDTQRYIAHRLNTAGGDETLFSPDAIREIHTLSKGVPRLINIVCDHALLYGYIGNLDRIDRRVVLDCTRDLSVALELDDVQDASPEKPAIDAPAEPPLEAAADSAPGRWRSWLYLTAALAAAGVAFYFVSR